MFVVSLQRWTRGAGYYHAMRISGSGMGTAALIKVWGNRRHGPSSSVWSGPAGSVGEKWAEIAPARITANYARSAVPIHDQAMSLARIMDPKQPYMSLVEKVQTFEEFKKLILLVGQIEMATNGTDAGAQDFAAACEAMLARRPGLAAIGAAPAPAAPVDHAQTMPSFGVWA